MTLECPKCQSPMRSDRRGGVTVEECTGCRGVFLDRGELEHLMDAEGAFYGRSSGFRGGGDHDDDDERRSFRGDDDEGRRRFGDEDDEHGRYRGDDDDDEHRRYRGGDDEERGRFGEGEYRRGGRGGGFLGEIFG